MFFLDNSEVQAKLKFYTAFFIKVPYKCMCVTYKTRVNSFFLMKVVYKNEGNKKKLSSFYDNFSNFSLDHTT